MSTDDCTVHHVQRLVQLLCTTRQLISLQLVTMARHRTYNHTVMGFTMVKSPSSGYLVITWMGNCLQTGKSSLYMKTTTRSTQPSIPLWTGVRIFITGPSGWIGCTHLLFHGDLISVIWHFIFVTIYTCHNCYSKLRC